MDTSAPKAPAGYDSLLKRIRKHLHRSLRLTALFALALAPGSALAEKVIEPPYVSCTHWHDDSGGFVDGASSCNALSGSIGSFASAFVGAATAEARQIVTVNIPDSGTTPIDVDVEIIRVGGKVNFGPAQWSGTERTWSIGTPGDYHRQTINRWLDWDIVLDKLAFFVGLVLPSMVNSPIKEVIDAMGTIHDAYGLYNTLESLSSVGGAEEVHITFSHDAQQGPLTLWAGLRGTASAVGIGTAQAFSLGQVSRFTISGIDPPGKPQVSGPSHARPGIHYFTFSNPGNNEDVRYRIKWETGEPIEETGFVPGGTAVERFYDYSPLGNHLVSVQAEERDGQVSGWTDHSLQIALLEPAPPRGMSATYDQYCDKVVVSWNEADYTEYYTVWLNTVPETPLSGNLYGTLSWEDDSVAPGVERQYRVKAHNLDYPYPDGIWSDQPQASTGRANPLAQAPSIDPPTTDDCGVALSWTGEPAATQSYSVMRSTNPSDQNPAVVGVVTAIPPLAICGGPGSLDCDFADNPPSPGTYYYWVEAESSNGCGSTRAGPVSAVWAGSTIPSPTSVVASDNLCSQIKVQWTGVIGFDDYVLRDGVRISGLTSDIYHDYTAERQVTYDYSVEACDYSCGACSAPSPVDTGVRQGLVDPPQNVSATDGTVCDAVLITWEAAPVADRYWVYRDTGSGPSRIADVDNTTFFKQYTTSPTPEGSLFEVYAMDDTNPGCYSELYGASASDPGHSGSTVGAPQNMSASRGSACDSVQLAWDTEPGAEFYTVLRDGIPIGDQITTTSFDDTSPTPGSVHSYEVKANSTCMSSETSSDSGFGTAAAPASLTAADGTSCGGIALAWDPVPEASCYEIRRNTVDDLGSAASLDVVCGSTTYDDVSATCCGSHFYWVGVSSGCAANPFSPSDSGSLGPDADADLVCDGVDNCDEYNPGQEDCQSNGIGDVCDIAHATSQDCDESAVPDECEEDCNRNGLHDDCDIAACGGQLHCRDFNANSILDICENPVPAEHPAGLIALALCLALAGGAFLALANRGNGARSE